MKRYRCPFLGILTENYREEIRAKKTTFADGDPAYTDWFNDRNQCTEQAEYVEFWTEQAIVPVDKELADMPRTGSGHIQPLAVNRSIIVKCPVHGELMLEHTGHHISAVDTKKSK